MDKPDSIFELVRVLFIGLLVSALLLGISIPFASTTMDPFALVFMWIGCGQASAWGYYFYKARQDDE